MEPRRNPRTVIDPKVRHVGFFAPPDRTQSGPPDPTSSPPHLSTISPSANSLSPVMIPPPRHASDSFTTTTTTTIRPVSYPVRESFNASDFYPPPPTSPSVAVEDVASLSTSSPGWSRRGEPSKVVAASSFPGGGFDLTAANAKPVVSVAASPLTTVSVLNQPIQPPAGRCPRLLT